MEAFVKHEGVVVPLNRVNVDTDQIIPKQFLKRIERTGFGQFLFNDWRFNNQFVGSPSGPMTSQAGQSAPPTPVIGPMVMSASLVKASSVKRAKTQPRQAASQRPLPLLSV